MVVESMLKPGTVPETKTAEEQSHPQDKGSSLTPPVGTPTVSQESGGVVAKAWNDIMGAFAGQCSVKGKTINLTESGTIINPPGDDGSRCVIVDRLIGGQVEYGDRGEWFPTGGWLPRDADSVRAKPGTGRAVYKYSLCEGPATDPLNWDCTPIDRNQTAER